MPFKIIRDDITKVCADAIVNTANPQPVCGSGTDAAVYRAAGEEKLLRERKKIGYIAPGQAAVTPAFQLDAKYIIHTVGPVWMGGGRGEFALLSSCYRKSLLIARHLGCRSIAFPLISTGVYGFPKDRALDIALEEISAFLKEEDNDPVPGAEMDVTLVVYDRKSFDLSSRLACDVEQFIDENYISARREEGMPDFPRRPSERKERETLADSKESLSEFHRRRSERKEREALADSKESLSEFHRRRSERKEREALEEAKESLPDFQRSRSARGKRASAAEPAPSYGTDEYRPEEDRVPGTKPSFFERIRRELDRAQLQSVCEEDEEPDALREEPEDAGSGFLWDRSSDAGAAPLWDRSSDAGAAPLWDRSSDAGAAPLWNKSADAGTAPLWDRSSDAGAAPSWNAPMPPAADHSPFAGRSLQDVVSQVGETFQESLLRLIDERGLTDVQVYKRANVDRRLFSKIRSNPYYSPKRVTAVAFALALGLNLDETRDFLGKAGLALSPASRFDLIISYCVQNRIYDIVRVNAILFDYDQPLLGA